MTYRNRNIFPEKSFLPAFLKKEKKECWVSACENTAEGWKEDGQWSGGIKRELSFSVWKLA